MSKKKFNIVIIEILFCLSLHGELTIPDIKTMMSKDFEILTEVAGKNIVWGEQQLPEVESLSEVTGYFDLYNYVNLSNPIKFDQELKSTVLNWQNKSQFIDDYSRVFFKQTEAYKQGDIFLSVLVIKDNLLGPIAKLGTWDQNEVIIDGRNGIETGNGTRAFWTLFRISKINEKFPYHFHFSVKPENVENSIEILHWSARKLISTDSDGDMLSDNLEEFHKTNASLIDSDNDNYSDFIEIELDSDPNDSLSKPIFPKVRAVYLIPKDRNVNIAYKKSIESALIDLQGWFSKQLNGPTFILNDPIVEIIESNKSSNWFLETPNGIHQNFWHPYNSLDEVPGAKRYDDKNIWAIFTGSKNPGGSTVSGGFGVANFSEDFMEKVIDENWGRSFNDWTAVVGHEIAHAFGLLHPEDKVTHEQSIMYLGIYNDLYPDTAYITEYDKVTLLNSSFFKFYDYENLMLDNSRLNTKNIIKSLNLESSEGGVVSASENFFKSNYFTLKAVPQVGYEFQGWFGDINSSETEMSFELNSSLKIKAYFSKESGDFDNDGVSNFLEKTIHKTNFKEKDTDGDSIPDGEELLLGLDPNKPDIEIVRYFTSLSVERKFTHYTEGWFYYPGRGWMWTNGKAYPYFYDATDKDWMYFMSGNDKPKFYSYKTGTWLILE